MSVLLSFVRFSLSLQIAGNSDSIISVHVKAGLKVLRQGQFIKVAAVLNLLVAWNVWLRRSTKTQMPMTSTSVSACHLRQNHHHLMLRHLNKYPVLPLVLTLLIFASTS
jgi:hypothetical protein